MVPNPKATHRNFYVAIYSGRSGFQSEPRHPNAQHPIRLNVSSPTSRNASRDHITIIA